MRGLCARCGGQETPKAGATFPSTLRPRTSRRIAVERRPMPSLRQRWVGFSRSRAATEPEMATFLEVRNIPLDHTARRVTNAVSGGAARSTGLERSRPCSPSLPSLSSRASRSPRSASRPARQTPRTPARTRAPRSRIRSSARARSRAESTPTALRSRTRASGRPRSPTVVPLRRTGARRSR